MGRYYIEKSEDAGLNYKRLLSSDDLTLLCQIGEALDNEGGVRWVIKDSTIQKDYAAGRSDEIIEYCQMHHSMIDYLKKLQQGG